MANPSYGRCYPFGAPAAGEDDQRAQSAEWRHLAGAWGDGIVNAFGSAGTSSFALTRSTGDRTVTLHLDEIRIKGCHFEPTQDTLTLTLPAVTAGWQRADRIVARFDPTAKNITFLVKTGTAVQSGTLPLPAVTRVTGGVWEIPLFLLSGGNVAASALDVTDQRVFIGDRLHGVTRPGLNTELNSGRSDGSQFYDLTTGHTWVQTYPGGVPTWTDIDDPAWSDITIGSTLKAGSTRPQWRLEGRGSRVVMVGEALRADGGQYVAGERGLGQVPEAFAPTTTKRFAIAVTGSTDDKVLTVRAFVSPTGQISMNVPVGVTVGGACYDGISYPLGI